MEISLTKLSKITTMIITPNNNDNDNNNNNTTFLSRLGDIGTCSAKEGARTAMEVDRG